MADECYVSRTAGLLVKPSFLSRTSGKHLLCLGQKVMALKTVTVANNGVYLPEGFNKSLYFIFNNDFFFI